MKATPRSALFQLNLVGSSYLCWCGHHRVDSETGRYEPDVYGRLPADHPRVTPGSALRGVSH
jgi:hypothetical protein